MICLVAEKWGRGTSVLGIKGWNQTTGSPVTNRLLSNSLLQLYLWYMCNSYRKFLKMFMEERQVLLNKALPKIIPRCLGKNNLDQNFYRDGNNFTFRRKNIAYSYWKENYHKYINAKLITNYSKTFMFKWKCNSYYAIFLQVISCWISLTKAVLMNKMQICEANFVTHKSVTISY